MGFAVNVCLDLSIGMEYARQLVTNAKLGINLMELALNAIKVI